MPARAFASIRPTKIKFYLRCMEVFGFTPEQVFAHTRLNRSMLEDIHALIEIPDYIRVVVNMMELTQSESLAFDLSRELLPGDFGVLGHGFAACENRAMGFKLWQKYSSLFFGDLIAVTSYREGNQMHFDMVPRVRLQPKLLQYFIEEHTVLGIQLYQLLGVRPSGESCLTLAYNEPPHAELYTELGITDVKFNAQMFQRRVALEHFENELFPFRDKETFQLCKNFLEQMANNVKKNTTLTSKLRFTVRENLPRIMSIQEAADKLNCSERTLRRNLKLENTTYNEILLNVREEMAKNYLATTVMSAGEIAYALGYSDAGSLRRAFKSRTGKTMSEYKSGF